MTIKHLVISGGGPTGLKAIGALQHLEQNGVWNITNCIGNKLLREINSTNLSREKIISEINNIIDNSYLFRYHN